MKKQFLILLTGLGFYTLASCNSTSNKQNDSIENSTMIESTESLEPNKKNSKQKISFNFNGENYANNSALKYDSEGLNTVGYNWLVNFTGEQSGNYKEITLNFNLRDFKLTTGKINTLCTINVKGFDDLDSSDQVLSSVEHIFLLDITNVKKIKYKSDIGTVGDGYSISGTFYGDFRNMTGTKMYKIENGIFENYTLLPIEKN
jgi:hypothetical protein